jgi:glycine hydroxymethyltransferase
MKEKHIPLIVNFIDEVLMHPEDEKVIAKVKKEVNKFMKQFPLYEN